MNHQIEKISKLCTSNKKLLANIIAAFTIKGTGFVVSIVALPLYINYFENNSALGVWFTMLTLVGWILSFDIGVGNGLRNKLTIALANNDYEEGKKLISSAYSVMGVLTITLSFVMACICNYVDLNNVLNIDENVVDSESLSKSVIILMIGILGCFFFQIVRGQIYALQLSSVNNFLHLATHLIMVVILFFLPSDRTISDKLFTLSMAYAIIINLPYILATIVVHRFTILKKCSPSFKYITKVAAKSVLGLGLVFFIVQILHMIISVSNELFISVCYEPKYCVDYQVYYRFFSLLGTLIMLALTPLWSAITKAYAEKKYMWIYKLNKYLSLIALGTIFVQCILMLVLQPLVNIWLGEKAIKINYIIASFFLIYSVEMIWISIQSTIVAGIGKLKAQLVFYSLAVIIKIAIILVCSKLFPDKWMVVILATVLGLVPYCLIQPILVQRLLREKIS